MSEHDKDAQRATGHERLADHRSFRDSLVQLLRRQLFGPSIGDGDGDLIELLTVSPLQLRQNPVGEPAATAALNLGVRQGRAADENRLLVGLR